MKLITYELQHLTIGKVYSQVFYIYWKVSVKQKTL